MKKINFIRIGAFLLILIVLFLAIQDILQQKWYYPNWNENTYKKINDLYSIEDNSIDVLFLGTSHMEYGVSPLEIYEYNNIVSYNLGTSGQPIEVSYYLANEFMKKQSPKVIMLDCSNLFYKRSDNAGWRYVLDSMKLNDNKIQFGLDYTNNEYVNDGDGLLSVFLPIYKYHSRWKELNKGDFYLFPSQSFMNGYYMWSSIQASQCTVEMMNSEMNYFSELEIEGSTVWTYENGIGEETYNSKKTINISDKITEEAEIYFKKIIELCDENDCKLILTKIPSVYFPQFYSGAWTLEKYNEANRITEKYELDFVDILYDANVDIDWNTDSGDCGRHLNILGAEKVSRYYADYLQNVFQISGKQDGKYDADLLKYNDAKEVAILAAQNDFETYMKELQNRENTVIFISANNNFTQGMNESQLLCFKEVLEGDNASEQLYRHSFIGVIDNGDVMYEKISQDDIKYCYETDGKQFNLKAGGIQNSQTPSIKLGETELSQERNGIDIVVYDKDTKCVIDSVSFEFVDGNCYTCRADGNAKNLDEYIYSIGG